MTHRHIDYPLPLEAYENGELNDAEVVELFQHLVDFQGWLGRYRVTMDAQRYR